MGPLFAVIGVLAMVGLTGIFGPELALIVFLVAAGGVWLLASAVLRHIGDPDSVLEYERRGMGHQSPRTKSDNLPKP